MQATAAKLDMNLLIRKKWDISYAYAELHDAVAISRSGLDTSIKQQLVLGYDSCAALTC